MVRYKEFRFRYPATYFSDYKNMLARSMFIWACEYYVVHETVLGKKKNPTPFNSACMVKLSNRSKTGPLIPNSSLFQWSPPQSKMDSVSDSETSQINVPSTQTRTRFCCWGSVLPTDRGIKLGATWRNVTDGWKNCSRPSSRFPDPSSKFGRGGVGGGSLCFQM